MSWDMGVYINGTPGYTGTMSRVVGGEALRTSSVEGAFTTLPTKGDSFAIVGEGLVFGTRMVTTSPVEKIISHVNNNVLFKTENSTYEITYEEVQSK